MSFLANNSTPATMETRPLTMALPARRLPRIPALGDGTMRISKLATDFLRFFVARGGSPRSAETYGRGIESYIAHLGTIGFADDVRDFTPDTVESYVESLTARGLRASTVNVAMAALHSMGVYGTRSRDGRGRYILAENPVARVYRPKRQRPAEKYLGLTELRALLAVQLPAPERLAIDLIVDTALRASELTEANVADLREDGEAVILSVKVKGGSHREVILGPPVAGRLIESLRFREARPTEPLLVNARGERYTRTSLSEVVLRAARKAGITRIPVRAHVLRHTVATLLSATGAELPTIAAVLNHSDLATVHRYVHRKDAVDEARAAVRRLIEG